MTEAPLIMVVDDNLINQNYFSMSLKKLGCNVTVCKDGFEAVSMARNIAFDMILMDIRMPRMSGVKAAKEISLIALNKLTPVIATSAESGKECNDDVFKGFLLKPVNLNQLFLCLKKWCGKFQLLQETKFNYQKALAQCSNDTQILNSLLKMFQNEMPENIKKLEKIIHIGDYNQASELIHKMRGSCRICCMDELDNQLMKLGNILNNSGPTQAVLKEIKQSHLQMERFLLHNK